MTADRMGEWLEAVDEPLVRSFSSFRVQVDTLVSSAGQLTRLKVALRKVSKLL